MQPWSVYIAAGVVKAIGHTCVLSFLSLLGATGVADLFNGARTEDLEHQSFTLFIFFFLNTVTFLPFVSRIRLDCICSLFQ